MGLINPVAFSNDDDNKYINLKPNQSNSNDNKSIFEEYDKDGIVNEQDFAKYKEVGAKVKSMGYFGMAWDKIRTIIMSFFDNDNKKFDGKLNVLNDNFQNINNQSLLSGIDLTKPYNEIIQQLHQSGIPIINNGDSTIVEIKNDNGQLLQKITLGEATRGGCNIIISNYNTQNQKTSNLKYSSSDTGMILNIVETYNYDESGKEVNGLRYLPPRHGVKYAKENNESVKVNIIEITPEHKPISGTKISYDEQGKKIE